MSTVKDLWSRAQKKVHVGKKHIDNWASKKKDKVRRKVDIAKKGINLGKAKIGMVLASRKDPQVQKSVLWFIFTLIAFLGYAQILFLDFSWPISSTFIWSIIGIGLIFTIIKLLHIIPPEQEIGVLLWILLCSSYRSILLFFPNIGAQFGQESNMVLFTGLFLVGLVLFILQMEQLLPSKVMIWFIIAVLILFFGAQVYGTITSGEIQERAELTSAQLESKDYNFGEIITNLWERQVRKGNGSLIEGQTENTFEFVGLKIESIDANKQQYYDDEEVFIDIDFLSNLYFPVTTYTSCKIDDVGTGKIDKPIVKLSASENPSVRCSFDSLPQGTHVVDVPIIYNFESTVRIPLKIMRFSYAQALTKRVDDSSEFLTNYVGGSLQAITSSGPVKIGVATSSNGMQTPLLYDPSKNILSRVRFQLEEEERRGEVYTIDRAIFDMPVGLKITSCDFGEVSSTTNSAFDNRWRYEISTSRISVGDYKTFSCELSIDKAYEEKFMPTNTQWSQQSIYFTIFYDYKLEEKTTVQVRS